MKLCSLTTATVSLFVGGCTATQHAQPWGVTEAQAQSASDQTEGCANVTEQDFNSIRFVPGSSAFTRVEPMHRYLPAGSEGMGAEPPTLTGATLIMPASRGLTAEWLQHVVECKMARDDSAGAPYLERTTSPLALKDITATVRSVGDGFAVTIESTNENSAKEVLRRARALLGI